MREDERRPPATETRQGRIGHRPFAVVVFAVAVRALHQIGAAVFLAAYLLGTSQPPPYFILAVGSGVVLTVTEWMRHRQLYREVSGLITLIKLGLLGAVYHGFGSATLLVVAAFFLASIGSHAPKPYRHRLLF